MKKITDLTKFSNKKIIFNEIENLIEFIHKEAKDGTAIHEVEQGIWDKLLKIGNQALGLFIISQGDGDMGAEVKLSDGHTVKKLPKKQTRIYRSIFGSYTIERYVYGSREGQKVEFIPLDARLRVTPNQIFIFTAGLESTIIN
jgi:hypothetical protein